MILTKKKALSLFAVISVVIGIGVLSGPGGRKSKPAATYFEGKKVFSM